MAVETRTVSYYTCDAENCQTAVYREVEHDGLPTGYHFSLDYVDGSGNATGVDVYACQWDHLPSAASNALNKYGREVDSHKVPEHHSVTGDIPEGSGGLQGRQLVGATQGTSTAPAADGPLTLDQ